MKNTMNLAFAVVLGGGIGSALGAAFHQVATGVALGVAAGIFAAALELRTGFGRRKDELLKRPVPTLLAKSKGWGTRTTMGGGSRFS